MVEASVFPNFPLFSRRLPKILTLFLDTDTIIAYAHSDDSVDPVFTRVLRAIRGSIRVYLCSPVPIRSGFVVKAAFARNCTKFGHFCTYVHLRALASTLVRQKRKI